MNIAQINIWCSVLGLSLRDPNLRRERARLSLSQSSYLRRYAYSPSKSLLYKAFPRLVHTAPNHRRYTVQVMHGERYSEGGHEEQPREDLFTVQPQEKRKIQTVEDLLREQIEKQEFYRGGDAGNNEPPKHGGGGGFGDWYNSNFPEFRDESIQVILATVGFVFLYLCIVRGYELTQLSLDFIRYLCGARSSRRLMRAFYTWEEFWNRILKKEKAEITTTTSAEEKPEEDDWIE
ncbi:hypothetical protein DsansV1_C19g0160501 [Dioscorea sansibarensis]